MVTPKSKLLVEQLLRRDSSYTKKDEIDGIEELRAFIKGLFDITDTFVDNYKQMNREQLRNHLVEVRDYVTSQLGDKSKLVEDIDIEIRNQNSDKEQVSSYYDDLIKLRAAIDWRG